MISRLFNISNYYFNPYAIPVFLVSILILFIGFFVLKQNKKAIINIAFFYQSFSVGLWLFAISIVYSSRVPDIALIWYRYFTFFGVVNIMPSLVFCGMAWIGQFKRRKKFLIINYLIVFVIYILGITTDKIIISYDMRKYFWGFYPIYGSWAGAFMLIYLIQFSIGFGSLYFAYKKEENPVRKMQIGTVIMATLIASMASVDFIAKFFDIPLYPYGYIPIFIYVSVVAYSIVRYKTFDIETVVHKTVMWLFSFSFIIVPVFFLYRWFFPYIKESIVLQTEFWIISFLSLTFYLRVVQPKVDHFFQRRRFNLSQIERQFTEDLVHLKGFDKLIRHIENIIKDTLYPQNVDIFIYNNEDKKKYKLVNKIDKSEKIVELKSDDQFLLWLAKNDSLAYRQFIEIDPRYASIREKAENYFNLTKAIVVVPLVLNEKLVGVVNLGRKANLRRYSALDFSLLTALKNQSAIAISNSLVYENIENQVRQRTKQLVEVQKQLIHAEKLATVGTLAGGVAHEINNPLTAILTNVQMLLADSFIEDESDRESLQLIEEATKRCRAIVKKMMVYAGKPLETTKISQVDLSKVVNNVIAFLKYQLEQDNVGIITGIDRGPYIIEGNHNELEQVLTNIILNARDSIKRGKKSGNIGISLFNDGEVVKIKIKDEGTGMSKKVISNVFNPFFTTKEVGEGLGLGLSICLAIVERHKGVISVQSEVGEGTVFTIQFPQADKIRMSKTRRIG